MLLNCLQDLHNNLYETYYFNFISPISRSLLEDLGKAALEANCVPQIAKVLMLLIYVDNTVMFV